MKQGGRSAPFLKVWGACWRRWATVEVCEQRFCKPKWEGGPGGKDWAQRGDMLGLLSNRHSQWWCGMEKEAFHFTHKVIILTSNCLSPGFWPNPSQLHINLSVIFSFVCSNICLAKPPILYKFVSGTDKCHSCTFCFMFDLLDVLREDCKGETFKLVKFTSQTCQHVSF